MWKKFSLSLRRKCPVNFKMYIDTVPGRKIRAGSGRKAQETDWNLPEKIQKISGWNTASTCSCFRCFP
jgi:hypothetical protein